MTAIRREMASRQLPDDFYLTQAQRQDLAQQIHPLLKSRGVPGTHDVPLAKKH